MLIIKIEIWPKGDKTKAKLLHYGKIWNDCTGSLSQGNYKAEFYARESNKIWRKTIVKGFPRLVKSAWHLLKYALNAETGKNEK